MKSSYAIITIVAGIIIAFIIAFIIMWYMPIIGILCLFISIALGIYIGYKSNSVIDNSDKDQDNIKEQVSNEYLNIRYDDIQEQKDSEDSEDLKKQGELEEKRAKAILLAKKYPKAMRRLFMRRWGIQRILIEENDIKDISENKLDVLVSYLYYRKDEQELNDAFRKKLEAALAKQKDKKWIAKDEAERKAKKEAERKAKKEAERKAFEKKFNSLITLYPLAIQYYYAKNYGIALDGKDAVIARGKYKIEIRFSDLGYSCHCHSHIMSLKNVVFDTKVAICDIDSQQLKDLQCKLDKKAKNTINKKEKEYIKLAFQENVIKNERRKKYFKLFCAQTAQKENIQEYCINHLQDLDIFITQWLETEYNNLKKEYPKGIEYYDSNNDFCEGEHLVGIDYWDDCINKADLIKRQHKIGIEYDKLYAKYPNGIEGYKNSHGIFDRNLCCVFEPSKEEIVSLGEKKLHELEVLSKAINHNKKWINEQSSFANKCRKLHNMYFENWGCYYYDLEIETPSFHKTPSQEYYRIWQHFCESYCSDSSLDYTYNPQKKELYEIDIPKLKSLRRHYVTSVYDKIIEYIKRIKKEYGEVLVLLGDSGIKDIEFKKYHYLYLVKRLTELSIFYGTKTINPQYPFLYKYIVFVEVISSNEYMKKQCLDVITRFQDSCPHITYISLAKELDSIEMSKIIKSTKQKKEKDRKEEEEKQERIRIEKERERLLEEKWEKDKCQLLQCVSSWQEPLRTSVKCFSIYYYYPTTCDWEANGSEWEIRNLIWNFKANPNKPQSEIEIRTLHKNAANKILKDLKKCLLYFFGEDISKLTFACIPSSKALITERRYKDFSSMVCNELGIENAYDYIHVIQDGEAKHIGGTIQATYTLDSEFFKKKFVILFDDVITSGKSMEKFKNMIMKSGGYVIGGISIGKTKHDRQSYNPIDLLRKNNQDSEYINDLPF